MQVENKKKIVGILESVHQNTPILPNIFHAIFCDIKL
jgi:hypothetical protein